MNLTSHDLKQINNETLDRLPPVQLLSFSKLMLADFKEAMDRLNQNSNNSSIPPGSTAPWVVNKGEQKNTGDEDETEEVDPITEESLDNDDAPPEGEQADSPPETSLASEPKSTKPEGDDMGLTPITPPVKRTAGKQRGAKGYGRTQRLPVTAIMNHAPTYCAVCNTLFDEHNILVPWTAFYSIDIAETPPDQPGIHITNTKHVFLGTQCACGHHNQTAPHSVMPDANWPKTHLSEWRLVGPRFAGMITMLSKRFRNSRRLTREFLKDFLHIELSIGTIDQTIREAGRSVEPLEEALIQEIEAAALAYVDETSWKESGKLHWLWVFRTVNAALFLTGKRDRTIFCKVLMSGRFKGTVMSDGWIVYREYANRLRCWAHLIRKARGLSDSCSSEPSKVGYQMLTLLTTFTDAIYLARSQDEEPYGTLAQQYEAQMKQLKALCEAHQDNEHAKLRAFSRELLNDWDIIMRPMHNPALPLTNNEAEQALRHWVIDRRLSHGTRTPEGTRSFTLLASVIETCRIRGAPPWDYLTKIIAAARKGMTLPALPPMQLA